MSLHAPQVERKWLIGNKSYSTALRTRTIQLGIAVYNGKRANTKLNTIQSHIRNVVEDSKIGIYSDRGHQGFLLLINIFHIMHAERVFTCPLLRRKVADCIISEVAQQYMVCMWRTHCICGRRSITWHMNWVFDECDRDFSFEHIDKEY